MKATIKNRSMTKLRSFKRYLIKWQAMVAILVILGYSFIMNWYFVHGLDQSNLMSLTLEMQAFSKAYENQLAPEIPHSIHFNGYLGWQKTPNWVKSEFPDLQFPTQLELRDVKLFKRDEVPLGIPNTVAFVVAKPLFDGKIFYLTREIDIDPIRNPVQERVFAMLSLTWPLALSFLILILIAVQIMIKRLTQPMEGLANWADSLTLEDIGNVAPTFGFEELNRIARLQQATFSRIANVLDQEQEFLRNASHELRTPIAVIKSNSELLNRVLIDKRAITCVERINRAALDMQQMTETLLWLSREEQQEMNVCEVNIAHLITSLVRDNQYLLQGKAIKLNIDTEDKILVLAKSPCSIVLSNLIRNAFQYTTQGEVNISLYRSSVIIKNTNDASANVDHTSGDYGFGLGLNLVDRIVKKMNWRYQFVEFDGGRNVTVDFQLLQQHIP